MITNALTDTGKIVAIHCDGCPEVGEGELNESFQELWNGLKNDGWIAFKVGQEWKHRCPSCVEED